MDTVLHGFLHGVHLHNLDQFRFESGKFPLATWETVFTAIGIYLTTIFLLKSLMENQQKLDLKWIVPVHNAFLCLLSLLMAVGITFEIVKIYFETKSDKLIVTFLCDPERRVARGPQIAWFYIFFLSKFYELLDTVIIVLKKRPVIFLHVYHHCITIVLTFAMLENNVILQWICILSNCLVHVPMYYYYAISSLGYSVWWKKYITVNQIIQFVVDVGACLGGLALYYDDEAHWKCSGKREWWAFGITILMSFLVLFLAFYKSTYNKEGPEVSHRNAERSTAKDKFIKPVADN